MTKPEIIKQLHVLADKFLQGTVEEVVGSSLSPELPRLAFSIRHEFPFVAKMLCNLNKCGKHSSVEHISLTLNLISDNLSIWDRKTHRTDLQMLEIQKKILKKIRNTHSWGSDTYTIFDLTLWLLDQIQTFSKLNPMINAYKAKLVDLRASYQPYNEDFEALTGVIHLLDYIGDQFSNE